MNRFEGGGTALPEPDGVLVSFVAGGVVEVVLLESPSVRRILAVSAKFLISGLAGVGDALLPITGAAFASLPSTRARVPTGVFEFTTIVWELEGLLAAATDLT